MDKHRTKPLKAYKNLDFLTSADARAIRVLAEYLEPQRRFRNEAVERGKRCLKE